MNDHKLMYPISLRMGILSSIVMIILFLSFIPYAAPEPYKLNKEIVALIDEITLQIDRYEEPPPIDRPRVAVPAQIGINDDNVVVTIVNTNFREDIIRTTPVGPDIEIVPYYKLEVKPQPLNNPVPKYPEIARKAGLEGVVIVKMLVDADGGIASTQILKSSGNALFDEAALSAARQSRFTPAKQRDKCVRVWVSRPFTFRFTRG